MKPRQPGKHSKAAVQAPGCQFRQDILEDERRWLRFARLLPNFGDFLCQEPADLLPPHLPQMRGYFYGKNQAVGAQKVYVATKMGRLILHLFVAITQFQQTN